MHCAGSNLEKQSARQMRARRRLNRRGSSASETEQEEDEEVVDETELEELARTNGSQTGPASGVLEIDKLPSQKLQTFKVRLLWTAILVGGFFLILAAGHLFSSALILTLTVLIYHEVVALNRNAQKDEKLPLFYFLRYYWFVLALYASGYYCMVPMSRAVGLRMNVVLDSLVRYHLLISYMGAFVGFVLFIFSLRRFSLRYQFNQFSIMLLCLLLVVQQTIFQIANVYNGYIWFVVSSSAVIINDCFAYICGVLWGRTRLTKLSPKKTVEGFLGASVVTLIWAATLGECLSRYQVAICPQREIDFRPFHMWSTVYCEPHPVYVLHHYPVPWWLRYIFPSGSIALRPFMFHSLMLGVFAAFFAPFGGFFASALKRALKVKDFAETIPGHGGITDRFDCQIVMGAFTYLYARTFVLNQPPSVAHILKLIDRLPFAEKEALLQLLAEFPT